MRRRIYAIFLLRHALFVSIFLRELNLYQAARFFLPSQSGHSYFCYRFRSLLTYYVYMIIAHIYIYIYFDMREKRDNIFFLYLLLTDPNMYVCTFEHTKATNC